MSHLVELISSLAANDR